MTMIDDLEAMLEAGQDSALLRFTLGTAFLKQDKFAQAVQQLECAVQQDPEYSAAWKAYGKALVGADNKAAASDAFTKGIAVAEKRGDVFPRPAIRRARKTGNPASSNTDISRKY